jgi:hypothetical protein
MKTINMAIFALIMGAVLAAAGCAASNNQTNQGAGSGNPAITSAEQNQAERQPSPYDQPLMATGGDLVMRQVAARGIAG